MKWYFPRYTVPTVRVCHDTLTWHSTVFGNHWLKRPSVSSGETHHPASTGVCAAAFTQPSVQWRTGREDWQIGASFEPLNIFGFAGKLHFETCLWMLDCCTKNSRKCFEAAQSPKMICCIYRRLENMWAPT